MASRYEVVGELARGGMAEIVLARTEGPEGFARAVVLKRILPHLARREAFRTMFLDEARLMAGIHHANVVNVHELVEEDDQLMLVMDYLQGESAASLARASLARGESLDCGLMAHLVAEACAGLHAAHELTGPDGELLGLVHRDVSPQNVFITYDGHVQILDFGIAHAAGRGTETEAGQIKGKFAYMSPEQCRGKPLDRRSDVFALGTLLYELTTQHRLFLRDSDMQTMRAVCKEPIAPPGTWREDYPAALSSICLRALARDRSQRYPTAEAMELELREFLRTQAASPRRELARVMADLFAERIADKQAMLRALRKGSTEVKVAEAETRIEVQLPTAAADAESATDVTDFDAALVEERSPRRRGAMLATGALAVAALGLVAVVTLRGEEPAPAPASEVAKVELVVETIPAGATVMLAGVAVGETPLTLPMSQGATPVTLRIEREGFLPVDERVTPNVSQKLRLTLEARPAAPPASASAPVAVPRPPPKVVPRPPPTAAPSASTPYYKL